MDQVASRVVVSSGIIADKKRFFTRDRISMPWPERLLIHCSELLHGGGVEVVCSVIASSYCLCCRLGTRTILVIGSYSNAAEVARVMSSSEAQ